VLESVIEKTLGKHSSSKTSLTLRCGPAVALLPMGYFPTAPTNPTIAMEVDMLALFHTVHHEGTCFCIREEQSEGLGVGDSASMCHSFGAVGFSHSSNYHTTTDDGRYED
jgi:hypothetical protein